MEMNFLSEKASPLSLNLETRRNILVYYFVVKRSKAMQANTLQQYFFEQSQQSSAKSPRYLYQSTV